MNAENRKNRRNIYNRVVAFSVSGSSHSGTIDNISSSGVHVIIREPVTIREGDDISLTLVCADLEEDVRAARVIWADDSGFGAKFTD